MAQKDTLLDVWFPEKGIDLSVPFGQQAPGTTPDCLNVRLKEPLTGRKRGGTRAGLAKFIEEQSPAGGV